MNEGHEQGGLGRVKPIVMYIDGTLLTVFCTYFPFPVRLFSLLLPHIVTCDTYSHIFSIALVGANKFSSRNQITFEKNVLNFHT